MSGEPRVFIDTNVLLYLLSADTRKADRAEEILRSDRLDRRVSTQVIAEFAVNLHRKAGLDWPTIRVHIETLRLVCAVETVLSRDQDTAMELAERYRFSWWDAQILAVAQRCGAKTLYSEDLQHGQDVRGLRIENPFL
ncbi:hypothetical memebrane protein [Parvularcula bermudensis HTCC2503]|uniref:Ribonuclease VapC n=1 Tax=Parvularcula bermudensis (strain ATCC BAA-594 / HTCC2503 / KCTC 12087) TaxID=314260 RepID=E0THY4_PARBH|nr:PIN domain-containing protein [Parvularcula bermudensis]ADM10795.1 hypothetical memebrane protein [Parvularcula bermudensis HTCC2503]